MTFSSEVVVSTAATNSTTARIFELKHLDDAALLDDEQAIGAISRIGDEKGAVEAGEHRPQLDRGSRRSQGGRQHSYG